MKIEKLVLIAAMLGLLVACADKEADTAADTKAQPPAAETAAPPAMPVPEPEPSFDREAFLNHMHVHSIHLERINEALAAGDMEAVETPAYWMSTHDAIDGLPRGWGQHLAGIREEAYTIQTTDDIEWARGAAERLAGHCQACHEANGFNEIVL